MAQSIFIAICILSVFAIVTCRPSDKEKHVKGGGKAYNAESYSEGGEKGEKGYEGFQEVESGKKGNHDKERHKGEYAEEGGNKKSHHHDDGYYSQHEKGEEGKEGHHYEEHGSYAKGHSTKGGHVIHKLDQFKKNTEFYDEDHDEAHKEKFGGYKHEFEKSSGAREKGGKHKGDYLEAYFGKDKKFEKGSYFNEDAGHKKAGGKEEQFANEQKHGKKGGNDEYKKHFFEHQ